MGSDRISARAKESENLPLGKVSGQLSSLPGHICNFRHLQRSLESAKAGCSLSTVCRQREQGALGCTQQCAWNSICTGLCAALRGGLSCPRSSEHDGTVSLGLRSELPREHRLRADVSQMGAVPADGARAPQHGTARSLEWQASSIAAQRAHSLPAWALPAALACAMPCAPQAAPALNVCYTQ